jgi:cytochrome c oxidase cbb3-type subunit I/II
MPNYPWLLNNKLDVSDNKAKIRAMRTLGVPYPFGYEDQAVNDLHAQQVRIQRSLAKDNIRIASNKELIALIAYLQRLGTDIKISQNK